MRPDEICFVKALVAGSKPDSVIYVKRFGKAPGQSEVEYDYTAGKSATVGGQGVLCFEYRCSEGSPGQYQTYLQFLLTSLPVENIIHLLSSCLKRTQFAYNSAYMVMEDVELLRFVILFFFIHIKRAHKTLFW